MRCRVPGFAAIVAGSLVLLSTHGVLGHSDGPNPQGDSYAADVNSSSMISIDIPPYEGFAPPHLDDYYENVTDSVLDLTRRDLSRRAAKDFYLRVMPLGASITQGTSSSDGNGFRKWLRSQLRYKGWKVNMVGSKMDGNMADKDNEGHPGWHIDEIHSAFQQVRYMFPNLVLINAGTNDCNDNVDTANAGQRLKVMVDDILNSIPGVTVIISTLAKSRDHDSCASNVSQQFRDLVKNSYGGQRVGLADFNAAMTSSMLGNDGIHPNDDGYKLFAAVWWNAISQMEDQIQPPNSATGIDDSAVSSGGTCPKVAGNARGPIQSQVGSGHDDGNYGHHSTGRGALISARIEKRDDPKSITDAIPWHMFFANIVLNNQNAARSEALDDWIRIFHDTSTGINKYYFRQNLGGGSFGPSNTFDVDMNCDAGPLYAFHDFNNDGLADFFCLKEGSAVHVSLNRGGNPPRFQSIGQVVPTHDGYVASDVRIADIDGDGRADYCLINHDGYIICSRNGGQGDSYNWQGFSTQDGLRGMVFNARKRGNDEVIIADLNGDFRDDLLFIGDNGNSDTFINNRGWGAGIVPDWRSAGITHPGQGDYGIRGNIKFGRIYGSGRRDYIYLKEEKTYYDVIVWENQGGGGTKRKADGNFYCDMRGSGADDYVWIYMDGHSDSTEFFANIHQPPNWGHNIHISLKVPGPRMGIHLADWNGDGKCDVLVQDKASGTLTLYENRYSLGQDTITFYNQGVVSNQATCDQGWGVNIFDRGMRMADMDGDGRADILCLEPNGRTTAWLNRATGLVNAGQIKRSEGWDRANIRFADVEGSGRADLIHLNKYTGAGQVFKNTGYNPGIAGSNGGSSFTWTDRGVLYAPINRGECMHFTNQGGLGRADLLEVLPLSNRAWTYFNECPGGSGGDDGPTNDPGLPFLGGGGDYGNINDCRLDQTFSKIEDIPKSGPLICRIYYALEIFYNDLNDALNSYDTLIRDDYNRKFNIYAEETVTEANDVLDDKAENHGSDYFDCDVVEKVTCCAGCYNLHPDEECLYCATEGEACKFDGSFPGTTEKIVYVKEPEPCPPDFSKRGIGGHGRQSVYWSMRGNKLEDFAKDVGMDSKFINFGNSHRRDWDSSTSRSCLENPLNYDYCLWEDWYFGYPYASDDYTPEDVSNPKKLFDSSIEGWKGSREDLGNAIQDIRNARQIGDGVDPEELMFASFVPVMLIKKSIASMNDIVEAADKIEKEKRIANIVNWIGAIVFVLPIAGAGLETLTSTLLANIGKVLSMLGDLGTAGIGIYDAVGGNKVAWAAAGCAIFAGRGLVRVRDVSVAATAARTFKIDTAVPDVSDMRSLLEALAKID